MVVVVVGGFFGLLFGFFWIIDPIHQPGNHRGPGTAASYTHVVGRLYPGIKLYVGNPPDNLTELGTVTELAYDRPDFKSGKGVLVHRYDGKDVWFDREQILGNAYWMHADDPAAKPGR